MDRRNPATNQHGLAIMASFCAHPSRRPPSRAKCQERRPRNRPQPCRFRRVFPTILIKQKHEELPFSPHQRTKHLGRPSDTCKRPVSAAWRRCGNYNGNRRRNGRGRCNRAGDRHAKAAVIELPATISAISGFVAAAAGIYALYTKRQSESEKLEASKEQDHHRELRELLASYKVAVLDIAEARASAHREVERLFDLATEQRQRIENIETELAVCEAKHEADRRRGMRNETSHRRRKSDREPRRSDHRH